VPVRAAHRTGSPAPAFSTLTAAINDAGVIAGFYTDSTAVNHGFELTPAR